MLLFLTAEVQADEVRARIQSVEPLDEAAAQDAEGLARLPAQRRADRRRGAPPRADAKRRRRNGGESGDGEVSMVLLLQNGSEVEVKLPGRFKVSPQIAGAIKAVTGVVTVEAL